MPVQYIKMKEEPIMNIVHNTMRLILVEFASWLQSRGVLSNETSAESLAEQFLNRQV